MPVALSLFLVLFFLLMNAFFVAAEFSLVRVRKSQVEILVDEGRSGAKYTKLVADNVNAYLSACQLGITLASLALGWLGEPAVSQLIEGPLLAIGLPEAAIHGIAIAIGFVVITALHIVVGELIPKSLAIFSTERYALFTATPLVWFYRITYPIMWLFNSITNGVMKLLGHDIANEHEVYTDEEIKLLIDESTESGLIDPEQNEYVDNIFDLGDKDAEAIMTPRTNVICLDLEDSLEENLALIMQYKYTRYPVCRGNKDRIVGFVHVKDLYTLPPDSTMEDLRIRTIQAVPEGIPIAKLLQIAAGEAHEDRRGHRRARRHGRHRHHERHHGADRRPHRRRVRARRLGGRGAPRRRQLPHRRLAWPSTRWRSSSASSPRRPPNARRRAACCCRCSTAFPTEGDSVTIEHDDGKATFTVVDMDRHRIDKVRVVLEQQARGRRLGARAAA